MGQALMSPRTNFFYKYYLLNDEVQERVTLRNVIFLSGTIDEYARHGQGTLIKRLRRVLPRIGCIQAHMKVNSLTYKALHSYSGYIEGRIHSKRA